MKNICPPELKRIYNQGRVIPFIGAGASVSVSWLNEEGNERGPNWTEMVDQASNIMGFNFPELLRMRGTDLQILEYFRIKNGNLAPLINWMVRKMEAPDEAIKKSRIHKALCNLEKCKIFYTTNYDFFIERALRFVRKEVAVIATEAHMGSTDGYTQVVKFHGDFNNPQEMVMSEGHYHNRMELDSPMDLKLRADLLGKAVLFVGYSFSDINIAYLFSNVNKMFKGLPNSSTGKRAYIIFHNPSDFENQLFRARNIEVIPAYGDDKTAATSEILEDLRS